MFFQDLQQQYPGFYSSDFNQNPAQSLEPGGGVILQNHPYSQGRRDHDRIRLPLQQYPQIQTAAVRFRPPEVLGNQAGQPPVIYAPQQPLNPPVYLPRVPLLQHMDRYVQEVIPTNFVPIGQQMDLYRQAGIQGCVLDTTPGQYVFVPHQHVQANRTFPQQHLSSLPCEGFQRQPNIEWRRSYNHSAQSQNGGLGIPRNVSVEGPSLNNIDYGIFSNVQQHHTPERFRLNPDGLSHNGGEIEGWNEGPASSRWGYNRERSGNRNGNSNSRLTATTVWRSSYGAVASRMGELIEELNISHPSRRLPNNRNEAVSESQEHLRFSTYNNPQTQQSFVSPGESWPGAVAETENRSRRNVYTEAVATAHTEPSELSTALVELLSSLLPEDYEELSDTFGVYRLINPDLGGSETEQSYRNVCTNTQQCTRALIELQQNIIGTSVNNPQVSCQTSHNFHHGRPNRSQPQGDIHSEQGQAGRLQPELNCNVRTAFMIQDVLSTQSSINHERIETRDCIKLEADIKGQYHGAMGINRNVNAPSIVYTPREMPELTRPQDAVVGNIRASSGDTLTNYCGELVEEGIVHGNQGERSGEQIVEGQISADVAAGEQYHVHQDCPTSADSWNATATSGPNAPTDEQVYTTKMDIQYPIDQAGAEDLSKTQPTPHHQQHEVHYHIGERLYSTGQEGHHHGLQGVQPRSGFSGEGFGHDGPSISASLHQHPSLYDNLSERAWRQRVYTETQASRGQLGGSTELQDQEAAEIMASVLHDVCTRVSEHQTEYRRSQTSFGSTWPENPGRRECFLGLHQRDRSNLPDSGFRSGVNGPVSYHMSRYFRNLNYQFFYESFAWLYVTVAVNPRYITTWALLQLISDIVGQTVEDVTVAMLAGFMEGFVSSTLPQVDMADMIIQEVEEHGHVWPESISTLTDLAVVLNIRLDPQAMLRRFSDIVRQAARNFVLDTRVTERERDYRY